MESKCMLCEAAMAAKGFCMRHYHMYRRPIKPRRVNKKDIVIIRQFDCLIDPDGIRWIPTPDYQRMLCVDGDDMARIGEFTVLNKFKRKYETWSKATNKPIFETLWFAEIDRFPEVTGKQDDYLTEKVA